MANKIYLKDVKYSFIFKKFIESRNHIDCIEPENFKRLYISVFDHWLNEQESLEQIFPFSVIIMKIREDEITPPEINHILKEYYSIEYRYIIFYIYLFKNFEIIFYDQKKKLFYKQKSIQQYLLVCQKSIREEKFVDIYIPKLKCIISGSFDLTHILYYQNLSECSRLINYASEAGLNILE